MELAIYIVDTFTMKQFLGNPAAVILLEGWLPNKLMQNISIENNLSETAFVVRRSSSVFDIRWFSPVKEIDFCGHATLASAFVIFSLNNDLSEITFGAEAVGNITVRRNENFLIEMAFPVMEPVDLAVPPEALRLGLSISPVRYLKNQQAYFAIMENEDQVKLVVPDLDKLRTLGPLDVVVTARGKEFDFTSRYFWPASGGAEDPVTGSIHAGLAPYWAGVLNKQELVALQASSRPGVLYCRVTNSVIFVSGYCVDYLHGKINV